MNPRNLLSPHRWRLDRVGLVVILLACANAGVVVQAENWPGWRGPAETGHTTETNLPLFWDGQTGSNVLWKVRTGGIGHSNPVVWDDYVFLTTPAPQPVEQNGKIMPEHHLIAFRVSDGKQLWRASIAPGKSLCQWHEYATPTKAMPDYVSAIATADGLLYYVSAGTSVIVRAGPKFELVAVNNLGGGDAQCGPTAAVSNGRLFVRDFEFLYCIGQPRH